MNDGNLINDMHNLVYLLAYKTQLVFYSGVIHAILDQNWDFKGFKQAFIRILEILKVNADIGGVKVEHHL